MKHASPVSSGANSVCFTFYTHYFCRPKANLTLEEGRDIKRTVQLFCQEHNIKTGLGFESKLEDALRARVVSPTPLMLMMGAVIGTGERKILAIPEGANSTVETGSACVSNFVCWRLSTIRIV